MTAPNFSPFPVGDLRRLTRRAARVESAIARWLAARPTSERLAALVGGPVAVRVIEPVAPDPHAAWCEARLGGLAIRIAGGGALVRAIAQHILGGQAELAAPRPLTLQEQAIWALVVSTALDDLDVRAEVVLASPAAITHALAVELGGIAATVQLAVPPAAELRPPPPHPPRVRLDVALPVVVARCALPRGALGALRVGDAIAVERCCEIVGLGGAIGLVARGVECVVATEYVPRAMALPNDAHVELTVTVGTVRLSLRELGELAVGAIVPLGRPLAGPFELHAGGSRIGEGELVNIDGEVGVRVVRIDGNPIEP